MKPEGGAFLVHGTCVALGSKAALLRGQPGSGKSDLALRFLYLPSDKFEGGTSLVADDQTELFSDGVALWARCPAALAGLLEVRGLGIVSVPASGPKHCVLVVDLVPSEDIERLPEADAETLGGVKIARLALNPWPSSAPLKLALALSTALHPVDSVDSRV